jgi:copper chaperone
MRGIMTELSIPDMSCGHCRASVQAALSPLAGVEGVAFDAEARTATVAGSAAPEVLLAALGQIGFPASVRS